MDEDADALRRTRLANERTYLAWWRTGLTAFAVSIGSGKLIPALAGGTTWPYTALGIGFAILGLFCCAYGLRRHREVEQAVRRDEFVPADDRMVLVLSVAGTVLGLLLVVVLFVAET
jgi:putative membrane protein